MSAPLVSVIVPAYRRKDTLPRAVRSVQAQTVADWELLVVDDASGDGTSELAESLGEPRLRVLRHEANRGPSVARQTALDAARGQWIALLDSDDEWLPAKLERQLASGSAVTGCGYRVKDGDREWDFIHPPVEDWEAELHFRCMLRAGSTLLVRREAALAAGGFDPDLRYYEDWDFALRLAKDLKVLPEPLVKIHVGPTRSMIAAEPSIRRFLAKHDAAFRARGAGHRRKVRGQHLQNLAAGAFENRKFALGCRWLVESHLANPAQSPHRLAALALAPVDAVFGSSLIARLSGRGRQAANEGPAP